MNEKQNNVNGAKHSNAHRTPAGAKSEQFANQMFVSTKAELSEEIEEMKLFNAACYRTRLTCNCKEPHNYRDGVIVIKDGKTLLQIVKCKRCAKEQFEDPDFDGVNIPEHYFVDEKETQDPETKLENSKTQAFVNCVEMQYKLYDKVYDTVFKAFNTEKSEELLDDFFAKNDAMLDFLKNCIFQSIEDSLYAKKNS